MYGRTWVSIVITSLQSSLFILSLQVLHINNLMSVGISVGCAYAPDVGSLLGLRFLGM